MLWMQKKFDQPRQTDDDERNIVGDQQMFYDLFFPHNPLSPCVYRGLRAVGQL